MALINPIFLISSVIPFCFHSMISIDFLLHNKEFLSFFLSRLIMNREELLELMKQKDDIEKELNDLSNELKSQNNVGMTEELVDREGYPR